MRSESTRAYGQPRLTKPTLGFDWDMSKSLGAWGGTAWGLSGAIIAGRAATP
jgi:hypothetical protein